jgi:hypothetical protein
VAIKRIWKPSPNYSSRGGSAVRLITLHTSEGAQTNQSLWNFISQASAQVSYSISVDNVNANECFEYVSRGNKPWSQANFNPVGVTGCFCTPSGASSGWSRDTWIKNMDRGISSMAAWVAEEARHFGIPIVALSPSQAQGSGRGVCMHRDLGPGGSNHHDCGSGFPMDLLIARAKGGGGSAATPPPATEEDMAASVATYKGKQYFAYVAPNGNVCVNGGTVDPNSNARSGAGIAIDQASGLKTVVFTNQGGTVCVYEQQDGSSAWVWQNKGWKAK